VVGNRQIRVLRKDSVKHRLHPGAVGTAFLAKDDDQGVRAMSRYASDDKNGKTYEQAEPSPSPHVDPLCRFAT
jgi:hypothetical protein